MYYTLLALFILSRLFFINQHDVFFDSGENLYLFNYSNYFLAMISGHFPPHEGYIAFTWPFFQLGRLLTLDPAFCVILAQIILATLSMICFYKVISFISDKRTALIASLIASLTPLFWITNVTIMMEIGYISLFFFSLYFLRNFLLTKNKIIYLHLSALTFCFAFLSHMLIVIWFPLVLALVFIKRKELLPKVFLTHSLYIAVAAVLNVFFISVVAKEAIPAVFQHLYLSKGQELAYLPLNVHGLLVSIRNFLIPLLRNNTTLLILLSFISLILLLRKDKKLFLFGLLWVIPAAYANQWWDSLLNGRHAVIASFGLAFLSAYLIKNNRNVVALTILYLLFVSVPIMNLLTKPIPYLEQAKAVKSLPANSLLIETHFAKPQVEKTFPGKLLTVNDPVYTKQMIENEINNYLSQKKPVFISSGALSEPYGLYSGPYIHNITLSYAKQFELEPFLTNYTLVLRKTIDKGDNLLIYQIISADSSPYPHVAQLRNSNRRLDYYDPLARLFWFNK